MSNTSKLMQIIEKGRKEKMKTSRPFDSNTDIYGDKSFSSTRDASSSNIQRFQKNQNKIEKDEPRKTKIMIERRDRDQKYDKPGGFYLNRSRFKKLKSGNLKKQDLSQVYKGKVDKEILEKLKISSSNSISDSKDKNKSREKNYFGSEKNIYDPRELDALNNLKVRDHVDIIKKTEEKLSLTIKRMHSFINSQDRNIKILFQSILNETRSRKNSSSVDRDCSDLKWKKNQEVIENSLIRLKSDLEDLTCYFSILLNRIESLGDMGTLMVSLLKGSAFNDIKPDPSNPHSIQSTGMSIDCPYHFRDSSISKMARDLKSNISESSLDVNCIENVRLRKYDQLMEYASLHEEYQKKIKEKRNTRIPDPPDYSSNKVTASSFFLGAMDKESSRTMYENSNHFDIPKCFGSSGWLSSALDKNSDAACKYKTNQDAIEITAITHERANVLVGGGCQKSSWNRCSESKNGSILLSARSDIYSGLDISDMPEAGIKSIIPDAHISRFHGSSKNSESFMGGNYKSPAGFRKNASKKYLSNCSTEEKI